MRASAADSRRWFTSQDGGQQLGDALGPQFSFQSFTVHSEPEPEGSHLGSLTPVRTDFFNRPSATARSRSVSEGILNRAPRSGLVCFARRVNQDSLTCGLIEYLYSGWQNKNYILQLIDNNLHVTEDVPNDTKKKVELLGIRFNIDNLAPLYLHRCFDKLLSVIRYTLLRSEP